MEIKNLVQFYFILLLDFLSVKLFLKKKSLILLNKKFWIYENKCKPYNLYEPNIKLIIQRFSLLFPNSNLYSISLVFFSFIIFIYIKKNNNSKYYLSEKTADQNMSNWNKRKCPRREKLSDNYVIKNYFERHYSKKFEVSSAPDIFYFVFHK